MGQNAINYANTHAMTSTISRYFANMLIMVAALFSLVACTDNKLQFKSIDITGADYARDFAADGAMLDHDGKPRAIRDFAGKIVVVFLVIPNAQMYVLRRCPSWLRSKTAGQRW